MKNRISDEAVDVGIRSYTRVKEQRKGLTIVQRDEWDLLKDLRDARARVTELEADLKSKSEYAKVSREKAQAEGDERHRQRVAKGCSSPNRYIHK